MTNSVLVEKSGRVLVLTLNRPEKKNALTRGMYETLASEIGSADTDAEIRCVLVQANGDMFTAGNDMMDFAALGSSPPGEQDDNPFLPALASARKPLVAAVNGRAVGIGFTMLLHCDMVFVSEDSVLTAPFVDLALVPEAASSWLLPLRIGHVRAFEIFVLGEPVSAARAVELGIANRAVPGPDLRRAAHAAAQAIAARSSSAVAATKSLLRDEHGLLERMDTERGHFVRQLRSAEFKDAFAAFAKRRSAQSR